MEQGVITAKGPVSNVSVHAHMRSGPHSLMENPLDLLVVVELSFLLGEQARRDPAEPPLVVTPLNVLAQLRQLGVQSANGKPIGRDAVYQSFARLRVKGYIRQIVLIDEETKQRTGVAYEFYDWPAWNPECPEPSASAQVGATSGIAGSGNAGTEKQERTNSRSSQVGATSGNAGSGNAGSAAFSQVGATSGIAGNPPHPPEEVTTSSPYPLTNTIGHTPASPGEGEAEVVFQEEDLQTASRFLQRMPGPWTQGRLNAERLAPLLLAAMDAQGWPTIAEVDTAVLARHVGSRPDRVTNPYHLLKKDRIPNLPLYEVVAAAASPSEATGDGKCPKHPQYRAGRYCVPCAVA